MGYDIRYDTGSLSADNQTTAGGREAFYNFTLIFLQFVNVGRGTTVHFKLRIKIQQVVLCICIVYNAVGKS